MRSERNAREQLVEFQENYPGVLKGENVNDVLQNLRARREKDDHKR